MSSSREIQELLTVVSPHERASRALAIGQKFLEVGRNEEAMELVDLAWRLGERPAFVLDFLVRLLHSQGRDRDALDRCREAALTWMFEDSPEKVIFAAELAGTCGEPERDHIIYSCLAQSFKGAQLPGRPTRGNPPYRIGYVLHGENQPASTLPAIFLRLAMAHDRRLFEPVFFSALHPNSVKEAGSQHAALRDLVKAGFELHYNAGGDSGLMISALSLAQSIHSQNVDVVVYQSQNPAYFVSALFRPAPIVVGFDHGNPHVYVSAALDCAFSAVPRFTIEHPIDSICLPPCFLNQVITDIPAVSRDSIQVPDDAALVVTSGLPPKFDPRIPGVRDFFNEVNEVLRRNPQVYWCVVGVTEADIPNLIEMMSPACAARLRCVGMASDITPYLKAATVYLDTFPISGGLAVHHAMRLGIPTFTYQFSFKRKFNKLSEYSMVGDFIPRHSVLLVDENARAIGHRLEELLNSSTKRDIHSMEGLVVGERLSDESAFMASYESTLRELIAKKAECRDEIAHLGS